MADFSDSWNKKGSVLFNAAQECYETYYTVYGPECNVHNTCATGEPPSNCGLDSQSSSSPCDSAKWHPSIEAGEASACNNSLIYPDQLNTPGVDSYMFFDDFFDCCQEHFPDELLSCHKDDDCVNTNATITMYFCINLTRRINGNPDDVVALSHLHVL